MRFYVEDEGVFSGGGNAVLNNLRYAARHPILNGSADAGDVPFIMRNVPAPSSRRFRQYVLGPQNALPWTRCARGISEWRLVLGLRVASEFYARRATAVFRTSSTIPRFREPPLGSPVLHNVLDTGFEEAATASKGVTFESAHGSFVSIGSGHSYRNLMTLVRGYAQYRARGGRVPLFVGGTPSRSRIQREVEDAARKIGGITISWGALPRPQFLAALRDSAGVVLPSLVEASPLSALEACALTPRVVMSDIVGHREILARFGPPSEAAFFEPTSSEELATALRTTEEGGAAGASHEHLRDPGDRERARDEWARSLTRWLEAVAEVLRGEKA